MAVASSTKARGVARKAPPATWRVMSRQVVTPPSDRPTSATMISAGRTEAAMWSKGNVRAGKSESESIAWPSTKTNRNSTTKSQILFGWKAAEAWPWMARQACHADANPRPSDRTNSDTLRVTAISMSGPPLRRLRATPMTPSSSPMAAMHSAAMRTRIRNSSRIRLP